MTDPRFRAIVHLKAKPGQERAVLDLSLEMAPEIRRVDGLHRLEINRVLGDPSRLVLYYWWKTPAHSDRYVAGPVYASFGVAPSAETNS
ncbi:MAG: putative quinol monooxygenase [Bryobacteraceae bacterium]